MSAHLIESLELKETQQRLSFFFYNSQLHLCTCLCLSGCITNAPQPSSGTRGNPINVTKNASSPTKLYSLSLLTLDRKMAVKCSFNQADEPFLMISKHLHCRWNLWTHFTVFRVRVCDMTHFWVRHDMRAGYNFKTDLIKSFADLISSLQSGCDSARMAL